MRRRATGARDLRRARINGPMPTAHLPHRRWQCVRYRYHRHLAEHLSRRSSPRLSEAKPHEDPRTGFCPWSDLVVRDLASDVERQWAIPSAQYVRCWRGPAAADSRSHLGASYSGDTFYSTRNPLRLQISVSQVLRCRDSRPANGSVDRCRSLTASSSLSTAAASRTKGRHRGVHTVRLLNASGNCDASDDEGSHSSWWLVSIRRLPTYCWQCRYEDHDAPNIDGTNRVHFGMAYAIFSGSETGWT